MQTADVPRTDEGRPFGIYVVVALLVVRIIQLVAAFFPVTQSDIVAWLGDIAAIPPYPIDSPVGILVRVIAIGLIVTSALAVVGMLRDEHWGWTLAIISTGFILAINLGWWVAGEPRYASMVASSILVFYLNQRDIRHVFDEPQR